MSIRDYKTTKERRNAIEKELNISLPHLAQFSFDEQLASTRNCENMIGGISVPVGIAGPLKLRTKNLEQRTYYIPLATTEGALVASISRGCKAITESGGVQIASKLIGVTRAPVFAVKNIEEASRFIKHIEEQFQIFKGIAERTSSHLKLLHIKSWMLGRNVFLRFAYDTQDAMGMNMVTIATAEVVQYIEEKTEIQCIALSGNVCVDKKANFLNFIEGRGRSVWADVVISSDIVSSVLKTTTEKIYEVAKKKLIYGSLLSGSIGSNAHAANILAALFLATGQDIAHVTESSSVVTEIDTIGNDLYASVYIPDLVIGTVGGGTELSTQKEALSILGITGGNSGKNAEKLSHIIGGVVLAGEVSLLSSLAENSLAKAHQKLGRGKR